MEEPLQGSDHNTSNESPDEFEKSLEHLERILDENQEEEQKHLSKQENINKKSDLSIWEDAIADIEQYLEKRKNTESQS
ncbi:MAG: hypothetical protein AAF378_19675 [Cyanobacteria bacterium P01_A01_bin.84]